MGLKLVVGEDAANKSKACQKMTILVGWDPITHLYQGVPYSRFADEAPGKPAKKTTDAALADIHQRLARVESWHAAAVDGHPLTRQGLESFKDDINVIKQDLP